MGAFRCLQVTFEMGVSMELGCFLAGSIISAGGDNLANKVEPLVTPIKDFLSCIFFAAIGKWCLSNALIRYIQVD